MRFFRRRSPSPVHPRYLCDRSNLIAKMANFPDLSSAAGLKALDEHLLTRSYISGFVPQFALESALSIATPSIKDDQQPSLFQKARLSPRVQEYFFPKGRKGHQSAHDHRSGSAITGLCTCSYQASRDDLAVYSALKSAPAASYPNAQRWYKHITALLGARYDVGQELTCPQTALPIAQQLLM